MKPRPPLRFRVPNPGPEPVSGDRAELARHLRDHRVARLQSDDMDAAAELLFDVLDDEFTALRDEAVYIDLRRGSDQSLSPAFRALTAAAAIEQGGAMLAGEGPEARAALIDLADDLGRLVVVDGAGEQPEWGRAIEDVIRYGRQARWIFVERATGQTPRAPEVLTISARRTGPGGAELKLQPDERRLVDAVSLVGRLAWSDLPTELREIGRRLVDRGVLEEEEAHWRTHSRDLSMEQEREAASLLVDLDNPAALMIAAEVLVRHGLEEGVLERLRSDRDRLIEQGHGLQCWELLGKMDDPDASQLRLAIAARIHNPRLFEESALPAAPRAVDRFHYGQILLEIGRPTDAIALLEKALEDDDGTVEPDELRLSLAQCELARGDAAAARSALDDVGGDEPSTALRRDVLLLGVDITTGEDDLDERLDALLERLPHLRGRHAFAARLDLARALHLTGRIRDGLRVLESGEEEVGALLYTRAETAYVAALLHREAGNVDEASRICERLRRSTKPESMLGLHLQLMAVGTHLDRGQLEEARELADALVAATRSAEYRTLHVAARLFSARARLHREGLDALADVTFDDTDEWFGPRMRAFEQEVQLRRGDLDPDSIGPGAPIGVRVVARVLGGGEVDAPPLRSRSDEARIRGDAGRAARFSRLNALLSLADDEDPLTALTRWSRDAETAGRACTAQTARFLVSAWNGDLSAIDLFERFGSHEMGRLAREIVAPRSTPDRLEREIASRVRRHRSWRIDVYGEAGVVWWLAPQKMTVVIEGRILSLEDSAIRWSVLRTLVEEGGAATKSQLLSAVWNIDDHHPLQDENRLRMAVYKLRKQLGDDGAEYVQTTDEGYALGQRVHVVREPQS